MDNHKQLPTDDVLAAPVIEACLNHALAVAWELKGPLSHKVIMALADAKKALRNFRKSLNE